jgi:tetratricopeptide (TPR) repeat protein
MLLAMPLRVGAQAARADRQAMIATLLDALKTAPSEDAAAPIELRITHLWFEQASPATQLLMGRGLRDLDAGAHEEAVQDFDDAVALDPGFAEAWHQRAIARWQQGDTAGAIRDIEETLKREPRHFGAFRTLAGIAETRKDWRGAYAAWQKVLEIDPKTPGGVERLKDLRRRALGDQT